MTAPQPNLDQLDDAGLVSLGGSALRRPTPSVTRHPVAANEPMTMAIEASCR